MRTNGKAYIFTFYRSLVFPHHWAYRHDTGAHGDETRFFATQHVQHEEETITKRCFIADTEKALFIINNRNILFKCHDDHIDLYYICLIVHFSLVRCGVRGFYSSGGVRGWVGFENNSNQIAIWSMFEVIRIRMPPKSIASFLSPFIIHIPSDGRNDRNII